MPLPKSRKPFTPKNPYRPTQRESSKIIFLSSEGSVTEELYFIDLISNLFSGIKSKIQLISVAEEAVATAPKYRKPEQEKLLSMVRPKHLVERIDRFKTEKKDIYEFEQHPDDEFWMITDVDQNWSDAVIDPQNNKTYQEEWDDAIAACEEKGYHYAISNPFFEVWLLLHHADPTDEDKSFAVSDDHPYEKTGHFRKRLSELGVPLKDQKKIVLSDYNEEKVKAAIRRAETLHADPADLCPHYFATTVYLLLKEIIALLPEKASVAEPGR